MRKERTFLVKLAWKADWTADHVADWLRLAIGNQTSSDICSGTNNWPDIVSTSVRAQQKYDPARPGRPPKETS